MTTSNVNTDRLDLVGGEMAKEAIADLLALRRMQQHRQQMTSNKRLIAIGVSQHGDELTIDVEDGYETHHT